MTLPVIVRPAARAELADGAEWHERRQAGQGDVFTAAVEQVFAEVAANPRRFPGVFNAAREAPVPGYPYYVVYYLVRPTRVDVISVFHTSRNPAVWQAPA